MVAALTFTGTRSVFAQQGFFFSGAALVTFGGAYAVLAYVAQKAVETYHWLTANEMVRGLALAETTPGPLIMVVQFVAFVGAYRDPGSLNPWLAAVLGALLTTWVTFVPCFVFIFLGAPYVERLRGNKTVGAILTGITAAVVGVIANLAYYFALHTLFRRVGTVAAGPLQLDYPHVASLHWQALVIAAVAAALIFRLELVRAPRARRLCRPRTGHGAAVAASALCRKVPPAGFEPALPPPEGGALSPELRGRQTRQA